MYLTINVYPEDVTPIESTERFKLIDDEVFGQLAFYENLCGDVFTFNRFTGYCLSDEEVSPLPLSKPLGCFRLEPTHGYSLLNTIAPTGTENEIRNLGILMTRFKRKDLFFNIVLLSTPLFFKTKEYRHITKFFKVSSFRIEYIISTNEILLIGKLEDPGNLGMTGKVSISKILEGEEIKKESLVNEDKITLSFSERDLRNNLLSVLIYPLSAL